MPTIFYYTLMLLLACCSASSTKALVWTSLGGHVSLSLAAVKVLLRILTRAPWGSFHVPTPMAHCAAVNKLKTTSGYYATIVAGEGGPLLHPSWPASGTCGHLFCNIRRQCQQGAVPWQTAIDRKQKKEEVQEQVIAADASPLEKTGEAVILFQHHQRCAEQDWSTTKMPLLLWGGA